MVDLCIPESDYIEAVSSPTSPESGGVFYFAFVYVFMLVSIMCWNTVRVLLLPMKSLVPPHLSSLPFSL